MKVFKIDEDGRLKLAVLHYSAEHIAGTGIVCVEDEDMLAAFRAAKEYISRTRGRGRPGGAFDAAGRWRPSELERRPCCDYLYGLDPWVLLRHCRSMEHVCARHGAKGLVVSVFVHHMLLAAKGGD